MNPKLNIIQIILRSFIHYPTNYSSFFYLLLSLKIGGELSGVNCPGGADADSLVPILKPFLCRLVKLFETVTPQPVLMIKVP